MCYRDRIVPLWDYKTDLLILEVERLVEVTKKLAADFRLISARLAVLEQVVRTDDQQILSQVSRLVAIFSPRPAYIAITFGGNMPLQVGSSATAQITILDQF